MDFVVSDQDRPTGKVKTFNGQFYASELTQLKEKVKLKGKGKLRRGVLLLQVNSLVYFP